MNKRVYWTLTWFVVAVLCAAVVVLLAGMRP
jgi:hypothetical protein